MINQTESPLNGKSKLLRSEAIDHVVLGDVDPGKCISEREKTLLISYRDLSRR